MPPSKHGEQTWRRFGAEIPRPLFNRHPSHDAPGNTSSPNLTHIFHRFARLSTSPPLLLTFSAVTIPYGIEPRLDRSYPRKTPPFRGNVSTLRSTTAESLLPGEKTLFHFGVEKEKIDTLVFKKKKKKKKKSNNARVFNTELNSIKFHPLHPVSIVA